MGASACLRPSKYLLLCLEPHEDYIIIQFSFEQTIALTSKLFSKSLYLSDGEVQMSYNGPN